MMPTPLLIVLALFGLQLAAASLATSSVRLGAGGADDITWSLGPDTVFPDSVSPGGTASFVVQWGVDNNSADPAARCILAASFWFGGTVINVKGPNCTVTAATQQLTCDLGPVPIGGYAPTVSFNVTALMAETPPHYLPVFMSGLNGFDNGPETFGRLQIV